MRNFVCTHARESFSDLLDGEPLPLLRRLDTKLHAYACPWCRPMFRELRDTKVALSALRDPTPDDPA